LSKSTCHNALIKHEAVVASELHKEFGLYDALKGASLSARDGDVFSMIGASGSGRNKFLRCKQFVSSLEQGLVRTTRNIYREFDHNE
jgi:ABC-type histidine transport system ATPase subunit